MEKTTFIKLIDSYLQGSATLAEQQLLEAYYQKLQSKHVTDLTAEEEKTLKELMFNNIMQSITKPTVAQTSVKLEEFAEVERPVGAQSPVFKLWSRIAVAAAILLIAGLGLVLYISRSAEHGRHPELVSGSLDIPPGKNTATITLADGSTIVLSEAKSGVVVDANNVKYNDGSAVEHGDPDLHQDDGELKGTRTIQTPRGGTYQITLPDGTKVWLNAASSLKFPSTFKQLNNRKVELSGEAYFEVAKDKAHPFIVTTDKQTVEVLGTHFNINSYGYEQETKTTLLEGSVQVTPLQKPKQKSILKPGEQAIVTPQFLKIMPVDVEVVTAWKNGNFLFRKEKLESILNKLAYWYDVEIIYEGEKPTMLMTGIIERKRMLSSVLHIIELTGGAKFRIEGRKVFVEKN